MFSNDCAADVLSADAVAATQQLQNTAAAVLKMIKKTKELKTEESKGE